MVYFLNASVTHFDHHKSSQLKAQFKTERSVSVGQEYRAKGSTREMLEEQLGKEKEKKNKCAQIVELKS